MGDDRETRGTTRTSLAGIGEAVPAITLFVSAAVLVVAVGFLAYQYVLFSNQIVRFWF
jgi:hypothetical protein